MSKTLHQFGMVLFDELEQIAIRRYGEFASLRWIKENLEKARGNVQRLREEAAKPNVDLSSLAQTADKCVLEVRDLLALVAQAARAVDNLRQIVHDAVDAEGMALRELRRPDRAKLCEPREAWAERVEWVRTKLGEHADTCRRAQMVLDLKRTEKAIGAAIFQVAQSAAALRSDELASALRVVAAALNEVLVELFKVIEAFESLAKVKTDPVVELDNLVAEQSKPWPDQIAKIVQDAARASAMRMGTVGLAFSGGGIRSATFNLGFLQGAARLRLLKQFDYLSTVSGGGYIGAWFAAWVLREGRGPAGSLAPDDADERTSGALERVQMQLARARVGEEPQPVYHLRAHSNYLAPLVGFLSIDVWTFVWAYVRKLLVNLLILLTVLAAYIAYPRLCLLLFTHSTSGPILTLSRRWLDQHPDLPARAVLTLAIFAALYTPRFSDTFFARRIGRRLHQWNAEMVALFLVVLGIATLSIVIVTQSLAWLVPGKTGEIPAVVPSLEPGLAAPGGAVLLLFGLLAALAAVVILGLLAALAAVVIGRAVKNLRESVARKRNYERPGAWAVLFIPVLGIAALASLLPPAIALAEPFTHWLTGDVLLFLVTFNAAWLGFRGTYKTARDFRERHRGPEVASAQDLTGLELGERAPGIVLYLAMMSFGVPLLFARPGKPFFVCPLGSFGDLFSPASWDGLFGTGRLWSAVLFGALVGLVRALSSLRVNLAAGTSMSMPSALARANSAFSAGLISGAAAAAVLSWLHEFADSWPGGPGPVMMLFGPALVLLAVGVGSAIEVGLIGVDRDEGMRQWRASLGAYLLRIGTLWTLIFGMSIYGPLILWWTGSRLVWAVLGGLVVASGFVVQAGRGERIHGVSASNTALPYIAVIARPVCAFGLVVLVSVPAVAWVSLAVSYLQGVDVPITDANTFLVQLSHARDDRTWTIPLLLLLAAVLACVSVPVNLSGLNAIFAKRLARCYLGASRPGRAPAEGRPNFAPTNSAGPVRQPNPISDDFPLRSLAIVRSFDRYDLVVDYRGPYHLINTAMNLAAGEDLARQERMAESFILSPLYCGSRSTHYRRVATVMRDLEADEVDPWEWQLEPQHEVPGYARDIRLGAAISVSGAAVNPNAGYRSSPLVRLLMTVLNLRLGLWLGNPKQTEWRRPGPEFSLHLFHELFGVTTNWAKYVHLSDGGHFENLGAYELVRRRCRYIVVCDAGADPDLDFRSLAGLVLKCRLDFGIRIELDISPLRKQQGTPYAKWHRAIGKIHYEDVDVEALPGSLVYIKPSLTGDEPLEVDTYRADKPSFPHEPTANQFFGESQFESYRWLGEHIALSVFGDAVRDSGPDLSPAQLFCRLRRG